MLNYDVLQEFQRLADKLGLEVPQVDELKRLEVLAGKQGLSAAQFDELCELMQKYRTVIVR